MREALRNRKPSTSSQCAKDRDPRRRHVLQSLVETLILRGPDDINGVQSHPRSSKPATPSTCIALPLTRAMKAQSNLQLWELRQHNDRPSRMVAPT